MSRRETWAAIAVLACLSVSGCRQAPEDELKFAKPVKVEKVAGQPTKLTLNERAVERLGLVSVPARRAPLKSNRGGATGTAIPYKALLFDKKGQAAAYVVVDERVFTRTPVVVDHYEGDLVVLASGLSAGAMVVTDGSAELSGVESGLS
jgi:hypothetical protein